MTTVSATTSRPYDWIRKIPSSLLKLDEIPLFGSPPEFHWDQFQSELQSIFQIDNLTIKTSNFEWTSAEELFKKLGDDLTPLKIHIPSLEGAAYWVMAEKDITELMSLLLQQKTKAFDAIDPDFEQGFYKFLAIEAISALSKSGFDPALVPQIQQKAELPQSDMLCLDATLNIGKQKIFGRLCISPELRKSFKQRYEKSDKDSTFRPPLSQQVEVTVHLEAGRTMIPLTEWSKVSTGDVVILDQCSIEPGSDKGRVMLTIQGHPFFRGKVKDGNIKILENPLYYETEKGMDTIPPEEEEEYTPTEEDELGIPDEETTELEDEFEEEEPTEMEEEIAEEPPAEKEEEKPIEARLQTDEEKKGPPKPEDISLPVVIEVGRLQMTVQMLMELQPGNILDLNVHPEEGIDLVVNGNRIGKGELIQVGELLGVRVLEMG